jgi:hypothetical protein
MPEASNVYRKQMKGCNIRPRGLVVRANPHLTPNIIFFRHQPLNKCLPKSAICQTCRHLDINKCKLLIISVKKS